MDLNIGRPFDKTKSRSLFAPGLSASSNKASQTSITASEIFIMHS